MNEKREKLASSGCFRLSQLDLFKSERLREDGITRAIENAERKSDNWMEKAVQFVVRFPKDRFMTEDVRVWSHENGLPIPPSARSWGAVIRAAEKLGVVRRVGYGSVSNPKAHRTPASVWTKENNKD